tara:strand:+ start:10146 stop:10742 length:597 start_codon:yes stop_codon:yes gene_type:complete
MAYEKFKILKSTAVPLPIENIDTDQIIPARFLKATERIGFGDNLFRDWRYNREGNVNENFILNNSMYNGKILVAGKNFGSGSSREHAAWAMYDYGFRCVISSFFADIFKNNCLNIGVLPLRVTQADLDHILELVFENPRIEITVDLNNQKLIIVEKEFERFFEINSFKKNNLINGLDDIDYLTNIKDEIINFSKKIPF